MTDHDDDVSRRYRELPRDEPPAALDAAIVASARQAVAPRRSHWTRALSIAAVLVLAVGITLRMQHEEPGIETAVPEPTRPEAPAAPVPAQPAPSSQPSTAETAAPISKRTESRAAQRAQKAAPPASQRAEPRKEAAPTSQSAEPPKEVAPAPRQDPAAEMALPETTTGAAATNAPSFDSAKNAAPTPQAPPTQQASPAGGAPPASAALPARVMAPTQKRAKDLESAPAVDSRLEELERIAKLREAGNDAEADAALAEFRRRNPGYRMPDAMWARVKPR